MIKNKLFKKGDTIIEVSFAIAIFSLVSVLSIGLMNNGLAMAEASLEYSMARNEIDAQAEALRFIHNSFYSELELKKQDYKALWEKITSRAVNPDHDRLNNLTTNFSICSSVYNSSTDILNDSLLSSKAFVINTRKLNYAKKDQTVFSDTSKFKTAAINPRIVYNNNALNLTENDTDIINVEGLWVLGVKSKSTSNVKNIEYYDFHIRACWYAPGHSAPSFIATIIRLYNPLFVEPGTR